jgi:hypothetical protein
MILLILIIEHYYEPPTFQQVSAGPVIPTLPCLPGRGRKGKWRESADSVTAPATPQPATAADRAQRLKRYTHREALLDRAAKSPRASLPVIPNGSR